MNHKEYIEKIVEQINTNKNEKMGLYHLWQDKEFSEEELKSVKEEYIYKPNYKNIKLLGGIILGIFLGVILMTGEFTIFFIFLILSTIAYFLAKHIASISKTSISIDSKSFKYLEKDKVYFTMPWKYCIYGYFKTFRGTNTTNIILVLVDTKLKEQEFSITEYINIDTSLRDIGKVVWSKIQQSSKDKIN